MCAELDHEVIQSGVSVPLLLSRDPVTFDERVKDAASLAGKVEQN